METQLEKAKSIIRTSKRQSDSDGELIVQVLLEGRNQTDLSMEELLALARGYNWWGRHGEAAHAMCLAVKREPDDLDLLTKAALHIRNAHIQKMHESSLGAHSLPELYEDFINEQIGPSWFWRVQKALEYELIATGEAELEDYEWQPGDDILHPGALEQAIAELKRAIVDGPVQAKDAVKQLLDDQSALRQSPTFDSLMAQIESQ